MTSVRSVVIIHAHYAWKMIYVKGAEQIIVT